MSKIVNKQSFTVLLADRIFKVLVKDAESFYEVMTEAPDKMAVKCMQVLSWALKESVYNSIVQILKLLLKTYDSIGPDDLRCLLG